MWFCAVLEKTIFSKSSLNICVLLSLHYQVAICFPFCANPSLLSPSASCQTFNFHFQPPFFLHLHTYLLAWIIGWASHNCFHYSALAMVTRSWQVVGSGEKSFLAGGNAHKRWGFLLEMWQESDWSIHIHIESSANC